jgi:hypothetical protein
MQEPIPGPTTGRTYVAHIEQTTLYGEVGWTYKLEYPDKSMVDAPWVFPSLDRCLEDAGLAVRDEDRTYQEA